MKNIKMSKNNKIFLGLLTILLTMSVGYAIFSDSINVTGTATANASFDMVATCTKGLSSETGLAMSDVDGNYDWTEIGYQNDTCSVSGKQVSFSVDLKYPGAKRFFTVKVENKGTMAAVQSLESIGWGEFDAAVVNVCEISDGVKTNCNDSLKWNNGSAPAFHGAILGIKDGNGFVFIESDDISRFVDDSEENIILQPGDSIYYLMGFDWSDRYEATSNSVSYSFDATVDLPFTQYTN